MMSQKIILTVLLFSVYVLAWNTQAATKSISNEEFKDVNGQRFWQVRVECDNTSTIYELTKVINTKQWCFSEASNQCFDTKLIAAQRVCSTDNISLTGANQSQDSPSAATPKQLTKDELATRDAEEDESEEDDELAYDYAALRKEKIELEDQRILIQQEKLSLRRKEIELKKRQLNSK